MHEDGTSQGNRGSDAKPGASMADVLALPAQLRDLVTWMMQREICSLNEIATRLGISLEEARQTIEGLVERGLAQHAGDDRYRSRPAGRTRRRVPSDLWKALDSLDES